MNWLLSVLEAEGSTPIADFPVLSEGGVCEASGLRLSLEVTQESGYQKVKAVVHSQEPRWVMFSLASEPVAGARLWNFDGSVEQKEIYHQSPHDVDAWVIKGIARQSVPLVAVQEGQHFHVALNGSASLYGNACSQSFDPESGVAALRSGDDGATPGLKPSEEDVAEFAGLGFAGQRFSPGRVIEYFYEIDAEQPHAFEFLLLTFDGDSLEQLRSSVYRAVDKCRLVSLVRSPLLLHG